MFWKGVLLVMRTCGRRKIYTDVPYIDKDNVLGVLRDAMITHMANATEIDYLIKFEKGEQGAKRSKKYRPDVNNVVTDNVANEVTNFKKGFQWSNSITLIRADGTEEDKTEAISLLNKQLDTDGCRTKIQEIGRYVEICGQCLEYIDINDRYEDGKAYFVTVPLDPRKSFMVYSNYYYDKRPMMGVTFREDKNGNRYFTCITDDFRFEIDNLVKIKNGKDGKYRHGNRSGEVNPFGIINMVEWIRDDDRTGCFERQIDDMIALNNLESDFLNQVQQNTDAVWHMNDSEFPRDKDGNSITPKSSEWIVTQTTPDGRQPFIKPLSINYDYSGILNNILSKRALILQKCNVPQRNDNSGGSTGIAMSDATGWSSAEMSASAQQCFQESGKMAEYEVILRVIKKSPHIPSDDELLSLVYGDVIPSVKRTKSYELTTKVNALATLIKNMVNGEDAIKMVNAFDDPNEVWNRSKDRIERYQESMISKSDNSESSDKIMQDESDQIQNSPMIDGMRTSLNETKDSNENQ